VIERVAPRQTRLSRRDTRGREHTLVANSDLLLIVTSVAQPKLKPHLLDRYIVAAHKGGLRPVICINKIDLASEEEGIDPEELLIYMQAVPGNDEFETFREPITVGSVLAELRQIGYTCICTSAVSNAGLDELRHALRGHITVASGQSGVGKSSLINLLEPGLNLKVAEVSRESEKGRHTTSHAQLLRLSLGGYIVDTPGIRTFDLWAVDPGELEAFFVEFVPLVPKCRFRNCLHGDEDGCAIREAVEAGEISLRRYLSYLKMLDEARRGRLTAE
jgi:ribosome biogenesis GTPase